LCPSPPSWPGLTRPSKRRGELDQTSPSLSKENPSFSKEIPNFSKLFPRNSKDIPWRFLAKSRGWRRRRPISRFSMPPRQNCPRVAAAPGERRRREPPPKFHSYHDFGFSGRECHGGPAGARSGAGGRITELTVSCRWGALSERPPQFAVDLLMAKIPIETGCQGRTFRRAASGGRDP